MVVDSPNLAVGISACWLHFPGLARLSEGVNQKIVVKMRTVSNVSLLKIKTLFLIYASRTQALGNDLLAAGQSADRLELKTTL